MVKLVDTTDLSSVGQRCPCRFKSYWEYLVALVNYSHLKEGASCFTETTCIKVSLNVEERFSTSFDFGSSYRIMIYYYI